MLGVEQGKLRQLVDTDLPALERALDEAGVPYTTGTYMGTVSGALVIGS